ncbi:class I SAM-dependent methyltransferase [Geodermatophilus sp. SYSU D00815]
MTETTPLRGLPVETTDGCRVLSAPDLGYADGAEPRLLEIVRSAEDLSSSSRELADAATDWGTTYSLVPTRSNVLRGLELPPDARVLEIGCGCGPITRYLGETVALVDSVEPMAARAAVARARTRDLPNVEVYVGTLDDVPAEPAYDVVVVIGVLEYVGRGALDPAPYLSFLRQCHAVLRDGGTLVVAIENPLGVKYLTGAVEDHTNRPFDSLEAYALESPARTFPRRTLEGLLAQAGFEARFLAAFPDYKLPRVVMTDELFRSSDQLAGGLPRFPSPDYLVPRMQLADEGLTWGTLVASGVAEHFANSFIALAGKGSGPSLWSPDRLATLFTSDRQPRFAVRADVLRDGDRLQVVRGPLYPARGGADGDEGVRHRPPAAEPVVAGRELLQVVLDEPDRRGELLRRWADLVPDAEEAPVDLVPHNVVLTDAGELAVFDQEWRIRGYDRDCLLLRGLFLSAVQLAHRTRPPRLLPSHTLAELVVAMGKEIDLEVDDALLDRFVAQESAFQGLVNTTDATVEARRARAAEELRRMWGLGLGDVRGGERFDVQWERAGRDIDELHRMVEERDRAREALEHDLAVYREAHDRVAQELAELRSRMPAALARRAVRGALTRTGLRRHG